MVHYEIFHEPDQHWKNTESSKSASVCSTHQRIKSGSLKDSRDTSDCCCPEQWSSQKGWCTQGSNEWMKVLQESIIIQQYEISVSKNHHPWISQAEKLFWCNHQSSNRRETVWDEITASRDQWSCWNHEICFTGNHKVTNHWMKHMKTKSFCWKYFNKSDYHKYHNSLKCEYSLRCNLNSWWSICNEQGFMVTECLKSYSIIFFSYVNKLSWCYRQTRLEDHCTISECKCCWLINLIWWKLTRWKISLSVSPYIKHSPEFL